jgi:hypothetical protein
MIETMLPLSRAVVLVALPCILVAAAQPVSACLSVQGAQATASKNQPNVILILADDKY